MRIFNTFTRQKDEFKTIEELNEAYRKWAEKRIKKYEEYGEQIRILKESLK